MNYKAVIFDLDGVICFTDKYHYLADIKYQLILNFMRQNGYVQAFRNEKVAVYISYHETY